MGSEKNYSKCIHNLVIFFMKYCVARTFLVKLHPDDVLEVLLVLFELCLEEERRTSYRSFKVFGLETLKCCKILSDVDCGREKTTQDLSVEIRDLKIALNTARYNRKHNPSVYEYIIIFRIVVTLLLFI